MTYANPATPESRSESLRFPWPAGRSRSWISAGGSVASTRMGADLYVCRACRGTTHALPGCQQDHLALAVQLGASGDHVAHCLVVPCDLRLRRPRRQVPPQPHPHADPRRQVKLAQRAVRRVRAVDLDDCLVAHGVIEPAAGCSHKERRGTAAGHRVGACGPVRLAGSPAHGYGTEGCGFNAPANGRRADRPERRVRAAACGTLAVR